MTLYTWRTGADTHPEDSVLQFFTDVVRAGGVKDLSSDNHFLVSERGAGANMSVDVAAGRAFIKIDGTNCYPVRNTATVNKSVTNNVSGNPRIDTVVVFANLGATPNTDGSGVAEVAVVAGTPAASPSAPDDAAVATAIGSSSYPFIRLANIAVSNGAATIIDANITDVRSPFQTVSKLVIQSASDAAPTTYDLANGNYIQHSLGADRTVQLANVRVGDIFFVEVTTNSHAITWFSGVTWVGGIAPSLTTAIDIFSFHCVAEGVYRGSIVGQGYA